MKQKPYNPNEMFIQIAHAEAILEENRRNMREIDSVAARRVHMLVRQRTEQPRLTLHDKAQSNEFLRLLLRRAQK